MVSCRLVVKKGNHTFSDVYFFFMPGLIILFIRSGRDWPFSSAATRHPLYLSWPTRPPNPTERMPLLPGLVYRLFMPFATRQESRVCHWFVGTGGWQDRILAHAARVRQRGGLVMNFYFELF